MEFPTDIDDSAERNTAADLYCSVSADALVVVHEYQHLFPFMQTPTPQNGWLGGPYVFSIPYSALASGFLAVRLPTANRGLLSLLEKGESLPNQTFERRMARLATYTCTLTPHALRINNSQGGVSCEVVLPLTTAAQGVPTDGVAFKVTQERLEILFAAGKPLLPKLKANKRTRSDWEKDVCPFTYDPDRGKLHVDPTPGTHLELPAEGDTVQAPLRKASEYSNAMPINVEVFGQAMSYAGIFSRKDREGELVSMIAIDNGSARGGDTNKISLYESPSLLCPSMNIAAKQSAGIRTLMRRCRSQFLMATVGKSVVFGNDTMRCEFDQRDQKFAPIPRGVDESLRSAGRLMLDQSDLRNLTILTMSDQRDPIAKFSVVDSPDGLRIKFTMDTSGGEAFVSVRVIGNEDGAKASIGSTGRIRVADLIKMYRLAAYQPLALYISDRVGMMESSGADFVSRQLFAYPILPENRDDLAAHAEPAAAVSAEGTDAAAADDRSDVDAAPQSSQSDLVGL